MDCIIANSLSFDLLESEISAEIPGSFNFLDEDLTIPSSLKINGQFDESYLKLNSPSPSSSDDGPDPKRMRKGGLDCGRNPGRNAEIARMNRERKKAYVSKLENTISTLEKALADQKAETEKVSQNLASANKNIAYLQDVLRNESSLGRVIAALSPAAKEGPSVGGGVIPITINIHVN